MAAAAVGGGGGKERIFADELGGSGIASQVAGVRLGLERSAALTARPVRGVSGLWRFAPVVWTTGPAVTWCCCCLVRERGRGLESQGSFLRLRRGGWLGVFERGVLKEH